MVCATCGLPEPDVRRRRQKIDLPLSRMCTCAPSRRPYFTYVYMIWADSRRFKDSKCSSTAKERGAKHNRDRDGPSFVSMSITHSSLGRNFTTASFLVTPNDLLVTHNDRLPFHQGICHGHMSCQWTNPSLSRNRSRPPMIRCPTP